jgi:thiamine biosynthesis lipoprotein
MAEGQRARQGADRGSGWRHVELVDEPAMGGRLRIVATLSATRAASSVDLALARSRSVSAARRVHAWAARLTRFDPTSELSRLNNATQGSTAVGPTLACVLRWATEAHVLSEGLVDATLLDERLAAETGNLPGGAPSPSRSWSLEPRGRRTLVTRVGQFHFDVDGIAKGWLADRALALLSGLPGAMVDADGDVAIAVAPGNRVDVGIGDPFRPGHLAAVLRVPPRPVASRLPLGIATSGVSVHHWPSPDPRPRHHLIDPRTREPAATDLVQATVVTGSARHAEALAKTAMILGRDEGVRVLERAGAAAAVLVTDDGTCVATLDSHAWLAAA